MATEGALKLWYTVVLLFLFVQPGVILTHSSCCSLCPPPTTSHILFKCFWKGIVTLICSDSCPKDWTQLYHGLSSHTSDITAPNGLVDLAPRVESLTSLFFLGGGWICLAWVSPPSITMSNVTWNWKIMSKNVENEFCVLFGNCYMPCQLDFSGEASIVMIRLWWLCII